MHTVPVGRVKPADPPPGAKRRKWILAALRAGSGDRRAALALQELVAGRATEDGRPYRSQSERSERSVLCPLSFAASPECSAPSPAPAWAPSPSKRGRGKQAAARKIPGVTRGNRHF